MELPSSALLDDGAVKGVEKLGTERRLSDEEAMVMVPGW